MSQTRLATVLFAIYFNTLNAYLNGRTLGGLTPIKNKFYMKNDDFKDYGRVEVYKLEDK